MTVPRLVPFYLSRLALLLLSVCIPTGTPQSILADDGVIDPLKLVQTDILSEYSILPESGGKIGIRFKIAPHWHIYWRNSGDSGRPNTVKFQLPPTWQQEELTWPAPIKFKEAGDIITYAYEDEVILFTDVTPPPGAAGAQILSEVTWLVCSSGPSGQCVPGKREHQLTIAVSPEGELSPEAPLFESYQQLAPLPIAELKQMPGFQSSEVEPVWLEADQNYLGLRFSKLKNKSAFMKSIQAFPYATENLVLSQPFLLPRGKTEVLLLFPARAKQEFDPSELRIEVVLDKAFLETPSDQAFLASLPEAAEQFTESLEPKHELRFRYHQSSEEEETQGKDEAQPELLVALLSAFFAGVILNLMPCVLPIISIKVMGFLKQAHEGCSIRHALMYCAGILSTFLTLALIVISLREAGVQLGWGFQFQSPGFVFILLAVIFTLSLSLFDVFSAHLPGIGFIYDSCSSVQRPYLKQFFDGVLTTLLSTPCTAPFLGTALVVAFSQPAGITIAIFLAIGSGLALPYFLLSIFPQAKCFLPKPGEWMNKLRHFMGFVLLGTVVWLLYILDGLVPQASTWALTFMLLTAMAFWVAGWVRESQLSGRVTLGAHATLIGLFFLSCVYFWPMVTTSPVSVTWRPYSPQAVSQVKDKPVFIDFTARWCVTCQVNKYAVLERRSTRKAFEAKGVELFRADWTNEDEVISQALLKYTGHKSVPQYILIPPGGEPRVLPTLLTTGIVTKALDSLDSIMDQN